MARTTLRVNATQLDANENFSTVSGFAKTFDSNDYEGDTTKTMRRAKAAYHAELAAGYAVDNRLMHTVTIESADGRQLFRECDGAMPSGGEEE